QVGQGVHFAGDLAHQLGKRLQLLGRAIALAAIRFGPLLAFLTRSRADRDAVQLQRRSAGAVEYAGTAVHQRIAFLITVGRVGQLHSRLNDPQHHEQRHHGQGEVGEGHLPGAAVSLFMALLAAPSNDDVALAALVPVLHAASLSSSYWLTQTSSWRKAGLTSCSISLRPASTASSVGLPARCATSVVRTHSSADSSVLMR